MSKPFSQTVYKTQASVKYINPDFRQTYQVHRQMSRNIMGLFLQKDGKGVLNFVFWTFEFVSDSCSHRHEFTPAKAGVLRISDLCLPLRSPRSPRLIGTPQYGHYGDSVKEGVDKDRPEQRAALLISITQAHR